MYIKFIMTYSLYIKYYIDVFLCIWNINIIYCVWVSYKIDMYTYTLHIDVRACMPI